MPYTKKVWVDRTVERPLTYIQQDNGDGTITLIPSEGSIISAGTPITADNLNNIEDGIATLDNEKAPKSSPIFDGNLTTSGKITTTFGGQCLDLKAGAISNHAYMGFYSDSADQDKRTAYLGYGSGNSGLFTIANTVGGIDLVGSVARVNGTDIEERGANANGEYVRFYNGTQITMHSIFALTGTGIKTMQGLNYPSYFITTPYVQITHRGISGKFCNLYALDPDNTKMGIVTNGLNGAAIDGTILTISAFGRWK